MWDLIVFLQVVLFNFKCAYVAYWNEKRRRNGFLTRNNIINERKRNNDLLYEMIPEALVPKLLSGKVSESGAACETYANTSIMFVYIKSYSELVKSSKPLELVRLLNSLYSKLDTIIEGSDVTKMDVVGGTYIAICGKCT
jgi:class 3 adenylate cyclase